jgi:hypothetical protein
LRALSDDDGAPDLLLRLPLTSESLLEAEDSESDDSESDEESRRLVDCFADPEARDGSADLRRLLSDRDVSSSLNSEPTLREELLPVFRR